MADSQRTRAAANGNAVTFASLGAFADVLGTGISADYMSQRSSFAQPGNNGWATHALTPAQEPLSLKAAGAGLETFFTGEMAQDLSLGVLRAWRPLTDDATVGQVVNLYLRSDMTRTGAGSYTLISACPLCQETALPLPPMPDVQPGSLVPIMAAATPDYKHVLFESKRNLTRDAPAQPGACAIAASQCRARLYEYDNGVVRLVGIFPDGTAAQVSIAGQGAGTTHAVLYTQHTMSNDGSRIFFTYPTNVTGAAVNATGLAGKLYMRRNATETVQLNASERTVPGTFATARFVDAASDGSRVFFTTAEPLTNDAPANTATKLYMYDSTKPDAAPDNLTYMSVSRDPDGDLSNDVQGVLGVSENGRYVYFVTTGQLVSGGPAVAGDRGIFVWHDGDISYIGKWLNFGDTSENFASGAWTFNPKQSRVTPDGRYLLFGSHRAGGLTGGPDGTCTNSFGVGCRALYLYSADDGRLACVSCRPDGRAPVADASAVVRRNASASGMTWHVNHALTDDGQSVFFSTADPIAREDANQKSDVYEFDSGSGTIELVTSGKEPSDSYFLDATPSGEDVFFLTRERLVGWDTDNAYDIYDARVDGGFPEPASGGLPCSGDQCQGMPEPAMGPVKAGSAIFRGTGDVKARLKVRRSRLVCRRGSKRKVVRGKVRCVKTPKRPAARRTQDQRSGR